MIILLLNFHRHARFPHILCQFFYLSDITDLIRKHWQLYTTFIEISGDEFTISSFFYACVRYVLIFVLNISQCHIFPFLIEFYRLKSILLYGNNFTSQKFCKLNKLLLNLKGCKMKVIQFIHWQHEGQTLFSSH